MIFYVLTLIIIKCPEIWLCCVTICYVYNEFLLFHHLKTSAFPEHIWFSLTLNCREAALHGRKKVFVAFRALSRAECHIVSHFVSPGCPEAGAWTGQRSSSEMRAFLQWRSCCCVCWRVFTAFSVSQLCKAFLSLLVKYKNYELFMEKCPLC